MDYCASKNQIKSYAPTATGSTLFAKNIDCVTLDADYIGCSTLTINGQSITGITSVTDKTRNIDDTTTANRTLHNGAFVSADLETTRITAIDSTGLQVQSPVTQSISSSTGGLTLSLINPTLGTASTNYMGLLMGTSATGSSRGWQMLYYNTNSAGSTNNRLEFKMTGYTIPTMSMIQGKVGIANAAPTEALDVTGNAKVSGTLAVTGTSSFNSLSATVSSLTIATTNIKSTSAATNTSSVLLSGLSETAKYIDVFFNGIGISTNEGLVLRVGTGTTPLSSAVYTSVANTPWRDTSQGNLNGTGAEISTGLANSEKLTGRVRFEKVEIPTRTTYWQYDGSFKGYDSSNAIMTIVTGFIAYTGGIGCIELRASNSNGNFDKTAAYLAAKYY